MKLLVRRQVNDILWLTPSISFYRYRSLYGPKFMDWNLQFYFLKWAFTIRLIEDMKTNQEPFK